MPWRLHMRKNNPSSKKLLDIAILTAGRCDLFSKCVDAVLPQMKDEYQIHVYNNGHPSTEYEEVYKKLPQGSIVKRSNTNSGYGGGANAVIRSGSAPLVLFITDDIFIHAGAIDTLVRTMDDPTIGLSGYKFLFPDDDGDPVRPAGKVQHIGMASNIRGDMIHPLIGWSSDNPKCNISREVLAVTGASFIVRRKLFNMAGGFDPAFGAGYYEDMNLCFTIRSLGGRIYINTDATATHGVAQTFKNEKTPAPLQQNQMIFRSRWLTYTAWSEFEIW